MIGRFKIIIVLFLIIIFLILPNSIYAEKYAINKLNLHDYFNQGNKLWDIDKFDNYDDNYDDEYDDDDDVIDEFESGVFLGALVVVVVIIVIPFYGPYYLLADEDCADLMFQKYPYERNYAFMHEDGKKWMINASPGMQYVTGNNIGYLSRLSARYERNCFEPSFAYYQIKDKKDHFRYSAMYKFMFARNQVINLRTGIGYSHLQTKNVFDGLCWNYQVDGFFKPFQLSLDYRLHYYEISDSAEFDNEFRTALGIFYKRLELEIGCLWNELEMHHYNGLELRTTIWF